MKYNHKQMILNPERWPRFPVLPLTRPDKSEPFEKELGLIFQDNLNMVVLGNCLMLPSTAYELNRMETIVYDTVDELLADGWTVD